MRGSLPAEMSTMWAVKTFNVYGNHLVGALPTLNYKDMTQCLLLTYPITNEPSCPFPPGVTSSCYQWADGSRYRITDSTCVAVCPTGKYSVNQKCTDCPGGKYIPITVSTFCLACPSGKFSGAAASSCTACAAGQYQPDADKVNCIKCPAGKFSSPEGLTACAVCPAGKFQIVSTAGQSSCPGVGATNCTGGDSALLPADQCNAWIKTFDGTAGTAWTTCAGSRVAPCSCQGTCGEDNTQIVAM